MSNRPAILAAVKTVELDGRRALQIADYLAAEFRRHPRDVGSYRLPLAGPLRLMPDNEIETMIEGSLKIMIRTTPRTFKVEAERAAPRPEARHAARFYADRGWWMPGWR